MIRRRIINELFDDLLHQIHIKDFYESTVNFIESTHSQYCRTGLLSKKQISILARIRNNDLPNQVIRWE